jgi:hypothetical protein
MDIYNSLHIERPNTEEYELNYKHKITLYNCNKIIFNLSFFLKEGNGGYNVFKDSQIDECVIKIIKDNIDREFYIVESAEPVAPYLENIIKFINICKSYNKNITIITGQTSDDIIDLYKLHGADIMFLPLFNLFCYAGDKVYSPFFKENTFEKRYLTLNRANKPMREYLYNYLKNNDLLKFGEYSFNFANDSSFNENIDKNHFYGYTESIIEKFSFNKRCFLNFVIESINEDYYTFEGKRIKQNFTSEKTYKALYTGLPFVLIGEPYILKSLNSFGIKTFSDYWDESYDFLPNKKDRITNAMNILTNICYEPENRLREIYNDTEFIHKHNVELVNDILNDNLKKIKQKLW